MRPAPAPAFASSKVGIVLLHGKTGTPNQLASVAAYWSTELVGSKAPEASWSGLVKPPVPSQPMPGRRPAGQPQGGEQ